MAGPQPRADTRHRHLLTLAKSALLVERVWPPLVLVAAVVAAFLAVSWFGLWLVVPAPVRLGGLAIFAVALVAALGLAARTRWPRRNEALARLDRDSGLRHRPFTTGEDALANPGADPATRALWDLHRRRAAEAAARTRVRRPSPRLVDRDTYALRAGVLLVLVAAAFAAGPEKEGRLAAAFTWRPEAAGAHGTRVDAWIDPPPYTGKPPVVLMGGAKEPEPDGGAPISAPAGSTVIVRAAGPARVTATGDNGLRPAAARAGGAPAPAAAAASETRLVLTGDGTLTVTEDGSRLRAIALRAVPDLPPRVVLSGVPRPNYRGSLDLAYAVEDDYGVVGAEARFGQPVIDGKPVTGRSLVEPPKAVLTLPATPGGRGDAKTTVDLSDHPWAGARVTMILSARDEAGNTGESKPLEIVLPARPFTNPLARALVEQRRNLVLDPDGRARVGAALAALDFAPELFDIPAPVHLGLHAAQLRLAAAKTDPELVAVADLLWAMALRIENGDLSQAEQDLRAAQKELREAMARGAPPEEIRRLTENLRKQMDKFLSEMARNAARNGPDQQSATNERNRTLNQKDLQSMMDRMEEAARNGDMAEAQRLLDQLSGIMNNLKSASRGAAQSQATREMNRSMGDLERMLRDQGDVRDQTFKQGNGEEADQGGDASDGQDGDGTPQDGSQDGAQPGKPGGQSPSLGDLQRRQGALSRQLQALQKKLRGLGMKGEQGFADAQEAMKQAEGALGKGQGGVGEAVGAQGRALEGLQQGMKGLGQQMAQGGGGQPGQAQAPGEGDAQAEGDDGTDPLGRPRQGRGTAQSNELDVSGGLAARAARVMEELRRRLGDPTRSAEEQDYLERLLKRY